MQSYRQHPYVRPARLFFLPMVIALAGSAQAELRAASTEDIISATLACVEISQRTPADLAAIQALGWQPATVSSKDGQAIATGVTILSHANNRSLLLIQASNCSVTARLTKASDFAAVQEQLRIQVVPDKEVPQNGDVVMFKGRQSYLIRPTGSPQSPGIAITTMLTRQASQ